MVSSRYNKYQIFITLFFIVIFISVGIIVFLKKHVLTTKDYFWDFIIISLSVYLLLIFFYRSPQITFDKRGINIRKLYKTLFYSWDQVTSVSLSTKENYSMLFIFGYLLEGMKMEFDDGKSFMVWGNMYSNMPEMRAIVTQELNDKIHFLKQGNEKHSNTILFNKKYSGNVWTTFNTLLIIGMIIFFWVKLKIKPGKEILLLIPLAFILILYAAFGTQMNFFEIKYGKLIIRNHYFPWKKKEYELKDIEEVSKETPYRKSTGLRIITYQFESKLFCAGSLRDHTWQELFDDLSSAGIKTT